jgi:arylsulfatase A-like enzyme
MRSVFAAVAGLFLGGVLLIAFSPAWELADAMLRERLFLASFNAIVLGWVFGLLLMKWSGSRPLLPFGLGMLATLVFGGPILMGLGFALFAVSLRPMGSLDKFMRPVGILGHLALPLALLLPANEDSNLIPDAPALQPGPGLDLQVSEQTPDVLFIVVDTLRADAILNPNVPTPHMDALREQGTWAPYAVTPANQTLPSHLSLFMGLDILKIGQRGNLSRWPTARQLEVEWKGRSLAHRMGDLGYRTAAVTSNPLLDMIPSEPEEGNPYQSFRDGFQTWAPLQLAEGWKAYLSWMQSRSLLGMVLPDRYLGFLLGQALNPTARRNYREHLGEGTLTTDQSVKYLKELQQSPEPYYFCAQYFDPHTPYIAPAPFAGTLARPELAPEGFDGGYQSDFDMRVQMRHDLRDGASIESQKAIGDFQERLYWEEVAYFDHELGRLLEAIEKSGRPTFVVLTADHGEGFGRHGNVEHGESLYDEELFVPMILFGSGVPQSQLAGAVDMVDATRTILARVGANADYVDGRDLLAQEAAPNEPQLSVRIGEVCLRSNGWKLTMQMRYAGEPLPGDPADSLENQEAENGVAIEQGNYRLVPRHLYFLKGDPKEAQDLLATAQDGSNPDAAQEFARLESLLRERLEHDFYPALHRRELSPKELARMSDLGYVD